MQQAVLFNVPTELTKSSFGVSHTVLLWFCVMVMLRFLSCASVFLAFPPPPPLLLFALNLPCRLMAVADALLAVVITICFFPGKMPVNSTKAATIVCKPLGTIVPLMTPSPPTYSNNRLKPQVSPNPTLHVVSSLTPT
jgi:hypothetical protein